MFKKGKKKAKRLRQLAFKFGAANFKTGKRTVYLKYIKCIGLRLGLDKCFA